MCPFNCDSRPEEQVVAPVSVWLKVLLWIRSVHWMHVLVVCE